MEQKNTDVKVPLISKIAYGMGDVGCNFSWMEFPDDILYRCVWNWHGGSRGADVVFQVLGCD